MKWFWQMKEKSLKLEKTVSKFNLFQFPSSSDLWTKHPEMLQSSSRANVMPCCCRKAGICSQGDEDQGIKAKTCIHDPNQWLPVLVCALQKELLIEISWWIHINHVLTQIRKRRCPLDLVLEPTNLKRNLQMRIILESISKREQLESTSN